MVVWVKVFLILFCLCYECLVHFGFVCLCVPTPLQWHNGHSDALGIWHQGTPASHLQSHTWPEPAIFKREPNRSLLDGWVIFCMAHDTLAKLALNLFLRILLFDYLPVLPGCQPCSTTMQSKPCSTHLPAPLPPFHLVEIHLKLTYSVQSAFGVHARFLTYRLCLE